ELLVDEVAAQTAHALTGFWKAGPPAGLLCRWFGHLKALHVLAFFAVYHGAKRDAAAPNAPRRCYLLLRLSSVRTRSCSSATWASCSSTNRSAVRFSTGVV